MNFKQILKFARKHWVLVLSTIYVLSPIDFIPEFLVWVLGPTVIIDDGFVLIGAFVHALWKDRREKNAN